MQHMKRIVFISLILMVVILTAYWRVWDLFFQQDEWLSLGLVQANGISGDIFKLSFLEILAGRGRILGSVANNLVDYVAPFHTELFYGIALGMHWVNALLLHAVLFRLTRNWRASLAGAIFFAANATTSQSITWISSHMTVLPNAFFVLAGMYLFLQRMRVASFLSFVIAFYFKETSLFMGLILIGIDIVTTPGKQPILWWLRRYGLPGLFFVAVGVIRLIGLYAWGGEPGVMVDQSNNPLLQMGYRMFFYPMIGIVHLFIPSGVLFRIAGILRPLVYDFTDSLPNVKVIEQMLISDVIAVYIAAAAGIVLFVLSQHARQLRRHVVLSLLMILLSFLPFIVLVRPMSSFFESRYYYLGAIAASYLLTVVYGIMMQLVRSIRSGFLRHAVFLTFVIVFSVYMVKQATFIQREIAVVREESIIRRRFLTRLDTIRYGLTEKPILLIEGDSPGMYGIADLVVPFQQGMGYTAMVWLSDTGKIPGELLDTHFLWKINSQGYKDDGVRGFGYFYRRDDLLAFMADNPNIAPFQIFAFSYNGSRRELIEITEEVRHLIIKGSDK